MIDLLGHVGYIFIALGIITLGSRKAYGWLLRLVGECIWLAIGIYLQLTSLYIWGAVFIILDLSVYIKWISQNVDSDRSDLPPSG